MLERLAAWFLNTYVAEYVGNVVTDQLSIGLLKGKKLKSLSWLFHVARISTCYWALIGTGSRFLCAGAVELEKLPLKKDALKKLKLPIDIKSGE